MTPRIPVSSTLRWKSASRSSDTPEPPACRPVPGEIFSGAEPSGRAEGSVERGLAVYIVNQQPDVAVLPMLHLG